MIRKCPIDHHKLVEVGSRVEFAALQHPTGIVVHCQWLVVVVKRIARSIGSNQIGTDFNLAAALCINAATIVVCAFKHLQLPGSTEVNNITAHRIDIAGTNFFEVDPLGVGHIGTGRHSQSCHIYAAVLEKAFFTGNSVGGFSNLHCRTLASITKSGRVDRYNIEVKVDTAGLHCDRCS